MDAIEFHLCNEPVSDYVYRISVMFMPPRREAHFIDHNSFCRR